MTLMTQAVMNGATLSQLREGRTWSTSSPAPSRRRLKIDTVPTNP
jgi:hypothetical protein